jgi:hypothetical protein
MGGIPVRSTPILATQPPWPTPPKRTFSDVACRAGVRGNLKIGRRSISLSAITTARTISKEPPRPVMASTLAGEALSSAIPETKNAVDAGEPAPSTVRGSQSCPATIDVWTLTPLKPSACRSNDIGTLLFHSGSCAGTSGGAAPRAATAAVMSHCVERAAAIGRAANLCQGSTEYGEGALTLLRPTDPLKLTAPLGACRPGEPVAEPCGDRCQSCGIAGHFHLRHSEPLAMRDDNGQVDRGAE